MFHPAGSKELKQALSHNFIDNTKILTILKTKTFFK